jgi:type III pantothenate kinase
MDIHLLAINVGNTRLALGTFVSGELRHVARVSLEHRDDWRAAVAQAWSPIAGKEGAAIAGACVNPPLIEALEHAVSEATSGHRVEWTGKDLDLPIRNATDRPEETGVDRLLNVAAAYEQLQKSCVVVDAGTAVTVSCCNDEGEFVGGAIAPGAAMQLEALHQHTAGLPRVALATPEGNLGRTTEQAIRHGVYHGVRGMVKEVVENFAATLGRWPEVIATGGDAKALFEGWEIVHAVVPDLTLYGIALAYAEHHIRNET